MLVLPLPVMPCRRMVLAGFASISAIARVCAAFNGFSGVLSNLFDISGLAALRRFLVMPRGKIA